MWLGSRDNFIYVGLVRYLNCLEVVLDLFAGVVALDLVVAICGDDILWPVRESPLYLLDGVDFSCFFIIGVLRVFFSFIIFIFIGLQYNALIGNVGATAGNTHIASTVLKRHITLALFLKFDVHHFPGAISISELATFGKRSCTSKCRGRHRYFRNL